MKNGKKLIIQKDGKLSIIKDLELLIPKRLENTLMI